MFDEFERQEDGGVGLDFGESADDAFGAAVANDPFAGGGMHMSSQSPDPMMGAGHFSDYTPEEKELMQRVDAEQQDRKRVLYEKQVKEQEDKNKRKQDAQAELSKWKNQRDMEIAGRRTQNEAEIEEYQTQLQRAKAGATVNPWERVVDNCEMNANNYVGGKDVTRMREAMIARKADITKRGGMNKAL